MDTRKRKKERLHKPPLLESTETSPKRARVHAQRKFALGSQPSSPAPTPIKELRDRSYSCDSFGKVNGHGHSYSVSEYYDISSRPKTEDFLTFLCFRGTSLLPPELEYLNNPQQVEVCNDSRPTTPTKEDKKVVPKKIEKKELFMSKSSASKESEDNEVTVRITRSNTDFVPTSIENISRCSRIPNKPVVNKSFLFKSSVKGKSLSKISSKILTRSVNLNKYKLSPATAMARKKTKFAKLTSVRSKKLSRILLRLSNGIKPAVDSHQPRITRSKSEGVDDIKEQDSVVTGMKIKSRLRSTCNIDSSLAPKSKDKQTEVHTVKSRSPKFRAKNEASQNSSLQTEKNRKKVVNASPPTSQPLSRKKPAQISSLSNREALDSTKEEQEKMSLRPSRKTKEVATVYLELISRKLKTENHSKSTDDDNVSVTSITELKALAKNKCIEAEPKVTHPPKVRSGQPYSSTDTVSPTRILASKSSNINSKDDSSDDTSDDELIRKSPRISKTLLSKDKHKNIVKKKVCKSSISELREVKSPPRVTRTSAKTEDLKVKSGIVKSELRKVRKIPKDYQVREEKGLDITVSPSQQRCREPRDSISTLEDDSGSDDNSKTLHNLKRKLTSALQTRGDKRELTQKVSSNVASKCKKSCDASKKAEHYVTSANMESTSNNISKCSVQKDKADLSLVLKHSYHVKNRDSPIRRSLDSLKDATAHDESLLNSTSKRYTQRRNSSHDVVKLNEVLESVANSFIDSSDSQCEDIDFIVQEKNLVKASLIKDTDLLNFEQEVSKEHSAPKDDIDSVHTLSDHEDNLVIVDTSEENQQEEPFYVNGIDCDEKLSGMSGSVSIKKMNGKSINDVVRNLQERQNSESPVSKTSKVILNNNIFENSTLIVTSDTCEIGSQKCNSIPQVVSSSESLNDNTTCENDSSEVHPTTSDSTMSGLSHNASATTLAEAVKELDSNVSDLCKDLNKNKSDITLIEEPDKCDIKSNISLVCSQPSDKSGAPPTECVSEGINLEVSIANSVQVSSPVLIRENPNSASSDLLVPLKSVPESGKLNDQMSNMPMPSDSDISCNNFKNEVNIISLTGTVQLEQNSVNSQTVSLSETNLIISDNVTRLNVAGSCSSGGVITQPQLIYEKNCNPMHTSKTEIVSSIISQPPLSFVASPSVIPTTPLSFKPVEQPPIAKSTLKQVYIAPKPSKSSFVCKAALKPIQIAPKVSSATVTCGSLAPLAQGQILGQTTTRHIVQPLQNNISGVTALTPPLHAVQGLTQHLPQAVHTIGGIPQTVQAAVLAHNVPQLGQVSSPTKIITQSVFVTSLPNAVGTPYLTTNHNINQGHITGAVARVIAPNIIGKVATKQQIIAQRPVVAITPVTTTSNVQSVIPVAQQQLAPGQPQILTVNMMPVGSAIHTVGTQQTNPAVPSVSQTALPNILHLTTVPNNSATVYSQFMPLSISTSTCTTLTSSVSPMKSELLSPSSVDLRARAAVPLALQVPVSASSALSCVNVSSTSLAADNDKNVITAQSVSAVSNSTVHSLESNMVSHVESSSTSVTLSTFSENSHCLGSDNQKTLNKNDLNANIKDKSFTSIQDDTTDLQNESPRHSSNKIIYKDGVTFFASPSVTITARNTQVGAATKQSLAPKKTSVKGSGKVERPAPKMVKDTSAPMPIRAVRSQKSQRAAMLVASSLQQAGLSSLAAKLPTASNILQASKFLKVPVTLPFNVVKNVGSNGTVISPTANPSKLTEIIVKPKDISGNNVVMQAELPIIESCASEQDDNSRAKLVENGIEKCKPLSSDLKLPNKSAQENKDHLSISEDLANVIAVANDKNLDDSKNLEQCSNNKVTDKNDILVPVMLKNSKSDKCTDAGLSAKNIKSRANRNFSVEVSIEMEVESKMAKKDPVVKSKKLLLRRSSAEDKKSISAFSPLHESSVYAFEPEAECSPLESPFYQRRKSVQSKSPPLLHDMSGNTALSVVSKDNLYSDDSLASLNTQNKAVLNPENSQTLPSVEDVSTVEKKVCQENNKIAEPKELNTTARLKDSGKLSNVGKGKFQSDTSKHLLSESTAQEKKIHTSSTINIVRTINKKEIVIVNELMQKPSYSKDEACGQTTKQEKKGQSLKSTCSVAVQCDIEDTNIDEGFSESGTQTEKSTGVSPFYHLPLAMAALGEKATAQLVQQMLLQSKSDISDTEASAILEKAAQLAKQYQKQLKCGSNNRNDEFDQGIRDTDTNENSDKNGLDKKECLSKFENMSSSLENTKCINKVLNSNLKSNKMLMKNLNDKFSVKTSKQLDFDKRESLQLIEDGFSNEKIDNTNKRLEELSNKFIKQSKRSEEISCKKLERVDMSKFGVEDEIDLPKIRRSGRASTSASTRATESDLMGAEEMRRHRKARKAAAAREEGWSSSSEAPLSPQISPDSLRGWPPPRIASPTPSQSSDGTTSSTPSLRGSWHSRSQRHSPASSTDSKRRIRITPLGTYGSSPSSTFSDSPWEPAHPHISENLLLLRAPSFFPTDDEFLDPLDYIEKIRPEAEQFGICRIVPPRTFKPECKVNDDMRFTAYHQYVHRLMKRWGPNVRILMAIKKCLARQNIELKSSPVIGGLEVDLVKLYEVIEEQGGLMNVIENHLWSKVADKCQIPKTAQDRITKLDTIYCKYLLPYATISDEERKALLDEVDKTHSLNKQNFYKKSESDSEDEDNDEECIVRGKTTSLNSFYRMARNLYAQWQNDPDSLTIDERYWHFVTEGTQHVCVHSASIDTAEHGYGFPNHRNSPHAKHPWNLKNLCQNPNSVLRSMNNVIGVSAPTLHVGMLFTTMCWYKDPHSLPWIEYLHSGASKIWYGIAAAQEETFHKAVKKLVPDFVKDSPIWLPSDTAMVPPEQLTEEDVQVSRVVQEPGQYVVVFPGAFISSVCTGYIISESAFFARTQYFDRAASCFDILRECNEPSMFSLDRLILSVANDSKATLDALVRVQPLLEKIIEGETRLRKQLADHGLTTSERLSLPDYQHNKKKNYFVEEEENTCEICRQILFISLVTNSQEETVYCLSHAIRFLQSNEDQLKNSRMLYTYSLSELRSTLKQLEERIQMRTSKKSSPATKKAREHRDSFSSTSSSNL